MPIPDNLRENHHVQSATAEGATAPIGNILLSWWMFFERKVLLNIATGLMIAAMGVMFYEASSRTIVDISNWWAEEAVRFLVVWSILLSIGAASRQGHYIRMDMLLLALPPRLRRTFGWIGALAGLTFSLILLIAGVQETVHLYHIGMITDSNLDLPLWQVRLVLPIGGALYGIYFLNNMLILLRGEDPEEPTSL